MNQRAKISHMIISSNCKSILRLSSLIDYIWSRIIKIAKMYTHMVTRRAGLGTFFSTKEMLHLGEGVHLGHHEIKHIDWLTVWCEKQSEVSIAINGYLKNKQYIYQTTISMSIQLLESSSNWTPPDERPMYTHIEFFKDDEFDLFIVKTTEQKPQLLKEGCKYMCHNI